jgi:hypothetical protein
VIGPPWGALYYGIVSLAIRRFNLLTPGREAVDESMKAIHPASAEPFAAASESVAFSVCNASVSRKLIRVRLVDEGRCERVETFPGICEVSHIAASRTPASAWSSRDCREDPSATPDGIDSFAAASIVQARTALIGFNLSSGPIDSRSQRR